MSLRLLLSDFCSKACATASAAKRPAAFRAAAAANAASEDTIIMCAQRCLPALRQVLQHAHTDHGKLIDGHCLDDPESVWASFGNEDKVLFRAVSIRCSLACRITYTDHAAGSGSGSAG